jgi:hypothetical protein
VETGAFGGMEGEGLEVGVEGCGAGCLEVVDLGAVEFCEGGG